MKGIGTIMLLLIAIGIFSCRKDYNFIFKPNNIPISFKNDIYPVLQTNCLGSNCHIAGNTALDMPTKSIAYTSLKTGIAASSDVPYTGKPFIDTLNAVNSVVYVRISSSLGWQQMPTTSLPQKNIADILSWIKQGAKDN